MSAESIPSSRERPGIWATGLALFSMFFGAGNIVFPLIIGRMAGDGTPYAIIGLAISAVLFPLLGLFAMMLYGGSIQAFLIRMGRWPAFILLFLLQMSQGPAGSVPRLITLMHATAGSYLPSLGLLPFSIGICALVFYLCRKPNRIIPLLGVVLTPALLLVLAFLVIMGAWGAPEAEAGLYTSSYCFGQGLKLGYQTTDLIAALLFATVILPHLSQGTKDPKEIRRRMSYASLIASALLMTVYVGLCWISSRYSPLFPDAAPEELLQKIAEHILGPFGTVFSSIAIFLACLTTAISLAAVFGQYLKKDLFREKIGFDAALGVTLGLAALLANLGFSGIVKLWGPILDLLYPALIVLCIFNIGHRLYDVNQVRLPVFITLGSAVAVLYFAS